MLTSSSISDLKLLQPDLFSKSGINILYQHFISSLLNCSLLCVPVKNTNKHFKKYWWNDDLSNAKSLSVNSFNAWKADGRPRQGQSFDAYSKAKKSFKKLIQTKKKESRNKISANLFNSLVNNKTHRFWRIWNANFKQKKSADNFKFDG